MGFFAISKSGSQTAFDIEACHLSFWVLAKPWHKMFGYKFCVDIGLRIKSKGSLSKFRIVLPFDAEDSQLSDLSAVVLDPNFSPLIFGKPVKIDGDYVVYDGPLGGSDAIKDRVIAVSPETSTAHPTYSREGLSIWTIELARPTKTDELTYIRFRIPAKNPWRVWASKGWGFAKRGVVVDFRISDVRESILQGQATSEAEHIVPIKHLFLFLVAPSYFVPNHFSPDLHYTRLLEPKVWKTYLASCSSYAEEIKFSIHQWRHTSGAPIDMENPYRAYMDLTREFGKEVFLYYGAAIIAAPILIHAVEAISRHIWKAIVG